MNDLGLKPLARNSSSFEKLEEVFGEAFPPEEIAIPFEDYVALGEQLDFVHALEIADGEKPIGLFLYIDGDGYSYLNYFAVDAAQRGHGYGQRALTQLLAFFGDSPLVADIECPIEGEDGFEIKLRRQKFYERNGFVVSAEPYTWEGAQYLVISNRDDYLDPDYIFRLQRAFESAAGVADAAINLGERSPQ